MRRGGPGIPVPESAHQGPDSAAGGVPGSACLAALMACRRQSGILHQAGWEGEGDQWKSSPASKAAPGQAYEPGYRFGRDIGRARAVRTVTQKGGNGRRQYHWAVAAAWPSCPGWTAGPSGLGTTTNNARVDHPTTRKRTITGMAVKKRPIITMDRMRSA